MGRGHSRVQKVGSIHIMLLQYKLQRQEKKKGKILLAVENTKKMDYESISGTWVNKSKTQFYRIHKNVSEHC